MNQANQPKKPFALWKIAMILFSIILIAGIFATISYYMSNPMRNVTRDTVILNEIVTKAAKSKDDNFFITKFVLNDYNGMLNIKYVATPEEWGEIHNHAGLLTGSAREFEEWFILTGFNKAEFHKLLIKLSNPDVNFATPGVNIDNFIIDTSVFTTAPASMKNNAIWTNEMVNNQTPLFTYLVSSLSPFVIMSLLILGWIAINRASRNYMNGGNVLGEQGASKAIQVKSDKKFADVAGNEEVKEEIQEVVDYLKNPKKYASAGARIPKGILLGGPPGTGKTLLAKATAGEAGVPFLFISASNFVEMFVGLGARRVREVFAEARSKAPAIVFIDELDAVGRSRGAGIGGGNDEREQTLNQILVEMDGMVENSGVIVMAATNRTDVLDPALLRPGRFDRTITVNLPDIKEREAILKLHAKGKRISPNVKFSNVARRTPGFSGAQLENVINEASLLSVREKTNIITTAQIDEAIDRVMMGPAKKSRTITEQENIAVAYHEAGHAVVGIKLRDGIKVQKITIIPRGNAGGYNLMLPDTEKYNSTKSELLASIASFMGGRVAESIIYGEDNVSTGAANDIAKATKIARKMVTEYGLSNLGPIQYEEDSSNPFLGRDYMKNASFSNKIGHEIDLEIRRIILEAEKQAFDIINENRQLLELIKDALILNETIVAEEIEYIAEHLQLPPTMEKTKEDLKSEYTKEDFDALFNEVAGVKKIEESKMSTEKFETKKQKLDDNDDSNNSNANDTN
ncbi:ATPase AAA [Metamycoplasma cloacale]|uniref:ATP-dependent zinc metalloprotease FtsH n=1 Tax=Metamycoplasma cloacale TaxID=92401 RepID=A0A2Z4LLA3_9BACT|nr:ATP-dependent zinc metalloprotease FtsH [Metamycoplasma cloacale]AWX42522.1 ATP-dependent zinc metalloprotease FtsH [Metamycoplasma cloacale]VEU79132.1 ATPase AAA [Metamycoplasma cloacale]